MLLLLIPMRGLWRFYIKILISHVPVCTTIAQWSKGPVWIHSEPVVDQSFPMLQTRMLSRDDAELDNVRVKGWSWFATTITYAIDCVNAPKLKS